MKRKWTDSEIAEMLIIRTMREKGISRDKAEEMLCEQLMEVLKSTIEAQMKLKEAINMKIGEAIEKSVYQGDYYLAGSIVDILRFRYQLNYDGVYNLFHKVTGISKSNFEALMLLADCY